MKTNLPRNCSAQRGSLLIVALVICAIIGISLASYLHLARTALTLSNRAVYNNAAVNLAEQGIEEAMYNINQLVANPSYTWPGWTTGGPHAKRKWTGVSLSQNTTAEYRVFVYNYQGISPPKAVARAIITLGGNSGPTIEKWIEVTLSRTSKFANGLVAKDSVLFKGNNATVDSWNSDPKGDGSVIQPFSAAVRNDNGSVGSISVNTDAAVVQNADIWGYVSTAKVDPTLFVGTNGEILGDPPSPGPWVKPNVDPGRVSTTFSATFEPKDVPTETAITNLGAINSGMSLPGDHPGPKAADGYYYYDADSINLSSSGATLTITDKVVLRLTNTSSSFSTSGHGGVTIGSAGYLSVYTAGNVSLAGNGVSNGVESNGTSGIQVDELGQPIKFQLWGTKTTGTQTINIAGNGLFSGIIYAPQGDVSIVGNGAVNGSVVANNITLSGNAKFHYDESLGNFGGGNPFRIGKWKELTTASDRNAYLSDLTF